VTYTVELTASARANIAGVLAASVEDFGARARERYAALIAAALVDLREDPFRRGSADRAEIRPGLRAYHLRHARDRAAGAELRVGRPRHLVVYAVADERVVVLGVLHDAMELSLWVGAGDG
jgi:toxin ParE1/3/4